ncbi:MAG TPA: cytochrome c/FTR1 family iron permease [Rhodothermales bacterium]|nr:cytochrome c/FTR1 family iron permease [Rhodothermales bacterium]
MRERSGHFNAFGRLILASFMLLGFGPSAVFAQGTQATTTQTAPSARALVHILDYVGQDYPGAVSEGKIINAAEYEEMTGFGRSAATLLQDLNEAGIVPRDVALSARVVQLQERIRAKADPQEIADLAATIRNAIIQRSGLQVAPLRWPDIARGQQVYGQYCVSCHGGEGLGDGPLAPSLEPKPANLVHGERIASLSPFQAYNTIRMGVEGTAMPSFRKLSDQEAWDLAFYVKSLQANEQHPDAAQTAANDARQAVTLEQIATLNDGELQSTLAQSGVADPAMAVAALRTSAPQLQTGNSLLKAQQLLKEALASYAGGDASTAKQRAIMAYLEGVEPVEPTLSANDASLMRLLEQRMLAVRSAVEQGKSKEEVGQTVELALTSISDAQDALAQRSPSAWFAFLMAASILLREGLEAFLIILAVLGVIRAIGHRTAALWVHAGWIAAILLGVVAWFFSDLLIRFGAAQREFMEGGISLLAVGVLLYVGFWLHSKTEIKKWTEFIDVRVKNMLQGGNLFGLAAISFFAVFREAFESVLFLSALTIEEGARSKMAIAAGTVVAIAIVLILAAVLLKYSARLPIRNLFKYSSFVMGVLSVILVGKGLHAIQEAGLVSITSAPFSLRFSLLGVYPTVETLMAQAVIVCAVIVLWTLPTRLATRTA